MKSILFTILTFTTVTLHAQIRRMFFVEDVETISYVTFNYCTDKNLNIYNFYLMPEKTTYENRKAIEKLEQYILDRKKIMNNLKEDTCYYITFQFVNKKYKNASLDIKDYDLCEQFTSGDFAYVSPKYSDTEIKRTLETQTENSDDYSAVFEISWPSPDKYDLTYKEVREEQNKKYIGEVIHVEIIGVIGNSYIYRSQLLDDPVVYGMIEKIN